MAAKKQKCEGDPSPAPFIVFHGCVVQTPSFGELNLDMKAIIVVSPTSGVIEKYFSELNPEAVTFIEAAKKSETYHELAHHEFILPGFIDCHIHAPQFSYTGTGLDLPLMGPQGWLETYTFPSERTLGDDASRALAVYERVVGRTLQCGTTSALYFGSLDLSPTNLLAAIMQRVGQRGFVGKVCMDRNSPENYSHDCSRNLEDSALLIKSVAEMNDSLRASSAHNEDVMINSPLVGVALTPRFIPTCSLPLLTGLGVMADRHNHQNNSSGSNSDDVTAAADTIAANGTSRVISCRVIIQTHAAESHDEVDFCRVLHPDVGEGRDLAILDSCGLLTSSTVLAHAVHMSKDEIALCASRGVKIAHCPLSNAYFAGSVLPVQSLLKSGVSIGLGTDVAGGYDPSMLSAIRSCIFSSKLLESGVSSYNVDNFGAVRAGAGSPQQASSSIDYKEGLWLATQGGARTLGLENITGSIKEGLMFDALVVSAGGYPFLSSPSSTYHLKDPPPLSSWTQASKTPHNFARSRIDIFPTDKQSDIVQKFLHCGDDRDIRQVWVNGKKVVERGQPCALSTSERS